MRLRILALALTLGASAQGQTSMSACGPLPDSTARQTIKVFGGLRVCLLATRVTDPEALPLEWAAKGSTVILETQRDGDNRRAVIEGNRVAWTINGSVAPIDSFADHWQKAVIQLLDLRYQADALREQSSALRGDIDSLPARRDRMRQRVDAIEKLQVKLDQQVLAARNRQTLERNEDERIQRQINDLQQRASAEERRAASLTDQRARTASENTLKNYYDQIQRLYEAQRRARSNSGESDKRLAELQEQMRVLMGDGNLTFLRMRLAEYDSTNVQDLEQQLTQLDAQRRLSDLDVQVEKARLDLVAILEARGKGPSR
jgi:hypothetical protein